MIGEGFIPHAPGNHANLVRTDHQSPQFSLNVQHAVLRHDQKVAVSRVESFLPHILARRIKDDPQTMFQGGVTGSSNKVQTVDPIDSLI